MGDEKKEDEVVITYETLFEIFRREKNRGELQSLDDDFLINVISYLVKKKSILSSNTNQSTLFAEEEKINAEKQLFNIKKILRDLYEQREKKVIEMALNKSRTQSPLIDETPLLKEELLLYGSLVKVLDVSRQDILMKLLNAEMPAIREVEPKRVVKDLNLKFVEDTPEFASPDMELLGPFSKDDTGVFPKKVADILLKRGCAELVESK